MTDPSVLVVTPTRFHGGLDVTLASLARQQYPGEMKFLIYDQLSHIRHEEVEKYAMSLGIGHQVAHMPGGRIKKGYLRNLAECYNRGLRVARQEGWDIMISLQDYIAVAPDGFQKMIGASVFQPNDIVTALVHHSVNPTVDKIVDPEGGLTIFAEPLTGHPGEEMAWRDARQKFQHDGNIFQINAIEWESNFSLIGPGMIKSDVWFDEEFDRGVAYENSDFASSCVVNHGAVPWLHTGVEAISLPHKLYFPEIEAEDMKYSNQDMFHAKWGTMIV